MSRTEPYLVVVEAQKLRDLAVICEEEAMNSDEQGHPLQADVLRNVAEDLYKLSRAVDVRDFGAAATEYLAKKLWGVKELGLDPGV